MFTTTHFLKDKLGIENLFFLDIFFKKELQPYAAFYVLKLINPINFSMYYNQFEKQQEMRT